MNKCIIILYYNAITPSATALLGTWLYFSPICWLSGRTMTGLTSKGSHKPNWQISIGAHRHRAKVGFCVEWHLDIWSVCPLFCCRLSACKGTFGTGTWVLPRLDCDLSALPCQRHPGHVRPGHAKSSFSSHCFFPFFFILVRLRHSHTFNIQYSSW